MYSLISKFDLFYITISNFGKTSKIFDTFESERNTELKRIHRDFKIAGTYTVQ